MIERQNVVPRDADFILSKGLRSPQSLRAALWWAVKAHRSLLSVIGWAGHWRASPLAVEFRCAVRQGQSTPIPDQVDQILLNVTYDGNWRAELSTCN
jgi:hypothetical protein